MIGDRGPCVRYDNRHWRLHPSDQLIPLLRRFPQGDYLVNSKTLNDFGESDESLPFIRFFAPDEDSWPAP